MWWRSGGCLLGKSSPAKNFRLRFELLTFELGHPRPALVAAVCRPLQYHKDFNQDSSNLLAGVVPSYNQILIVGDFNIHVRWPSDPLTRDFFSLIDSFSLAHFVSGPTQKQDHTLHRVPLFSLIAVLVSLILFYLTTSLSCV